MMALFPIHDSGLCIVNVYMGVILRLHLLGINVSKWKSSQWSKCIADLYSVFAVVIIAFMFDVVLHFVKTKD